MLAFVTSLRHPHNSSSYNRVEELFHDSVRSWIRQLDDRFVIVVVGNRDPRVEDPHLHFVQVDFPPPSALMSPRTGIPAVLQDKGSKLAVGLAMSRRLGASHIMPIDADDFVSRRIAGHVAEHPDAIGWSVRFPWRVNIERQAMRRHDGGTFSIVRTDLFPDPQLPLSATMEQLYAGYGDKLERWLGSHVHIGRDLGLPPLPFGGALYRVGTGESHSGISLGGLGRPIPRAIAEEFGVPRTRLTPLSVARSVLPSQRAFSERIRRPSRWLRGSP